MILTCPACATRYFVEDARLGPSGRTVRCASCGSAWRAHAEEPLELTASAEEGAVAREPLSFKSDDEPEAPPSAPELPKAFRAKQQQRRKMREAALAGAVWAGLATCFVGLFAAAYLFRVDVVKLYPNTAGAYAAVGVAVNPTGLEFEQVKAAPAADGLPAWVVSGVVRNVEKEAVPAPPIRVDLIDKAGKKVATRVIKVSNTLVAPGAARPFTVALADPDATAADVNLNFALDLIPPAKPKSKAKPHAAPAKPAPASKAAHPPLKTAQAESGLRPARSVPLPAPVDARPLPAGDPYALDSAAVPALSAPHG